MTEYAVETIECVFSIQTTPPDPVVETWTVRWPAIPVALIGQAPADTYIGSPSWHHRARVIVNAVAELSRSMEDQFLNGTGESS